MNARYPSSPVLAARWAGGLAVVLGALLSAEPTPARADQIIYTSDDPDAFPDPHVLPLFDPTLGALTDVLIEAEFNVGAIDYGVQNASNEPISGSYRIDLYYVVMGLSFYDTFDLRSDVFSFTDLPPGDYHHSSFHWPRQAHQFRVPPRGVGDYVNTGIYDYMTIDYINPHVGVVLYAPGAQLGGVEWGYFEFDLLRSSVVYTFQVVPEPSTLALAGLGVMALLGRRLRRRRALRPSSSRFSSPFH